MAVDKQKRRQRIRRGIRAKISGSAEMPRVSIYKSNKGIYAQVINDEAGHTLVSTSSKEVEAQGLNIDISKEVGKKLAEKAKAAGVEHVVFDRSGYIYHGRIKALADGAREGGLKF